MFTLNFAHPCRFFSFAFISRRKNYLDNSNSHFISCVSPRKMFSLIYVPFQRAGANEKVLCWQKVHLETILSYARGKIVFGFFFSPRHILTKRENWFSLWKDFFSMVNKILNFQDATFFLPPQLPPPKMMNFRKANNDKWLSIKRWQGKLFLLYIVQQTMPYPSQLSIETNLNFPLTLLLTSYIRVFHVPLKAPSRGGWRREKCV